MLISLANLLWVKLETTCSNPASKLVLVDAEFEITLQKKYYRKEKQGKSTLDKSHEWNSIDHAMLRP